MAHTQPKNREVTRHEGKRPVTNCDRILHRDNLSNIRRPDDLRGYRLVLGVIVKIKEAIEHTKNKPGMYVSFSGVTTIDGQGKAYMRRKLSEHYKMAREAWLSGDLETVAEFFGLYV